jgi:protein-disulfide isomerase
MRFHRSLVALALLATAIVGLAPSTLAQSSESFTEKGQMEQVIHDYLLAHPEVIVEALQRYQAMQDRVAAANQAKAVVDLREELTHAPDSPVLGNPNGDVSIVEFFDYRCPYCKLMASRKLIETLEQDGNVRIVLKEFPILGEDSIYAAKAALGAARQGKYRELHMAMMTLKGKVTSADVRRLAEEAGIDMARLEQDMQAPEIDAEIKRNLALADKTGIRGTPAFIINGQLIPGAIEVDEIMKRVAAARQG